MLTTKFYQNLSLIIISIIAFTSVEAQGLYKASKTHVKFFSEAPLENIEATNTGAASMLNSATREIAVVVPIKLFEFEKDLMREHFNENYMESDKFKNASFKAKINEEVNFSKPGTYKLSATGDFTIHGVTKKRTLEGSMEVGKKGMSLDAKFIVKLGDHDIEVPKSVLEKIAEEVEVSCKFEYSPK